MAVETKERPMPTGEGLTFEKVWALFQETDRQIKEAAERQKESERQFREMTERLQREDAERKKALDLYFQETERHLKENNKWLTRQIGELGNRFGEMIEYQVCPNLANKFREFGFDFRPLEHDKKIPDKDNQIIAELDIVLENDDYMLIVEVKSKMSTMDIKDHVNRIKKVKDNEVLLKGDRRVYLGAVAAMVFLENEREFAMKNGLFVIEQSGESFVVLKPEGEFSVREW